MEYNISGILWQRRLLLLLHFSGSRLIFLCLECCLRKEPYGESTNFRTQLFGGLIDQYLALNVWTQWGTFKITIGPLLPAVSSLSDAHLFSEVDCGQINKLSLKFEPDWPFKADPKISLQITPASPALQTHGEQTTYNIISKTFLSFFFFKYCVVLYNLMHLIVCDSRRWKVTCQAIKI